MPFIPHTPLDQQQMLEVIGAPDIEALFDEIPKGLRAEKLNQIPAGISEMALGQMMNRRASNAGAYHRPNRRPAQPTGLHLNLASPRAAHPSG